MYVKVPASSRAPLDLPLLFLLRLNCCVLCFFRVGSFTPPVGQWASSYLSVRTLLVHPTCTDWTVRGSERPSIQSTDHTPTKSSTSLSLLCLPLTTFNRQPFVDSQSRYRPSIVCQSNKIRECVPVLFLAGGIIAILSRLFFPLPFPLTQITTSAIAAVT
jgi:hypothetical protein